MYLPIVRWGDFEVIYDKKSHYSPGSVSWIQNGFVVYVQGFLDEGQLKSIVASVRLDDK